MKVRIKFRKEGVMKYIGHLDVMRYFQKLLRRADIPIAYSTGMSPHQIMSFAMPLGIGLESDAEYVDIEITDKITSDIAIQKMNECNVEGINVISFKELPEHSQNAMASISASDYEVRFRDGFMPSFDCIEVLKEMYKEPSINVLKRTKKSESITDIKPGIFSFGGDNNCMNMCLSCGSVLNIKPELLLGAVYEKMNEELSDFALLIRRKEMYTMTDGKLTSLDTVGTDIE